jgi:hypothetical protein
MEPQLIACSLTPSEKATVLAGYAAAAHLYQATARIDDPHADVSLRGEKEMLGPFLDRLITQESACCSFLRFSRTETPAGFLLRVSAEPEDPTDDGRQVLTAAVRAFFPTAIITGQ